MDAKKEFLSSSLFLKDFPENPVLRNDEIHVCKVMLKKSYFAVLEKLLSSDERTKANRFRFFKDRMEFVVARGFLRVILGRYLTLDPSELEFRYNCYGKPFLNPKVTPACLEFNLTHSDGIALYAISTKRPLGIDIERSRPPLPNFNALSDLFSIEEISFLNQLSHKEQQNMFFRLWTRKEAYSKALGQGLRLSLSKLDFLTNVHDEGSKAIPLNGPLGRWSIRDLTIEDSHVAAVVGQGNDWKLQLWKWGGSL